MRYVIYDSYQYMIYNLIGRLKAILSLANLAELDMPFLIERSVCLVVTITLY